MSVPLSQEGAEAPAKGQDREIISGSCACGHVTFSLDATPSLESGKAKYLTLSTYCHCTLCQRNHSAPFTWTTHWKPEGVIWTCPASHIALWEQSEGIKYKLRCADACGSQLGSWNLRKQEWSIWPETLERNDVGQILSVDRFRPTAHQFYGEWRICEMDDGLPKFIGYPDKSLRVG